jgi:hypothetical protein
VHLAQLGDAALLLHPRDANPGHYDAVLALCRSAGVEPRVLERSTELDLAQRPVVDGRAIAVVGESSRTVIPSALTWVALSPPVALEVALVVRASLEVTGMVAEGDQVTLEWTSRARTAAGDPYENFCIGVFTLRDGRIAAVREYMDTGYAARTAFAARR